MKIINLKDAINRRLYKRLIIVETPIHRVSCLNRTVLTLVRINTSVWIVSPIDCCIAPD
ncbi:MAG: hypothetical protein V7L30_11450 [Nostoc sp.]